MTTWCEHCRDRYDDDHYDDDGNHKVGPEYGPTGSDLAMRAAVERLLNAWPDDDAGFDAAMVELSRLVGRDA